MALFIWKETYSVGINSIDEQHKLLVKSLNELHEAMLNREAKEVVAGSIKGLSEYIGVHFTFEEGLMKKYNYPEYSDHKKTHEEFVAKIKKFEQDQNEGKLMLSMEVMSFLRDWLKNHIMGIDKKYSSFLKEKGAQ